MKIGLIKNEKGFTFAELLVAFAIVTTSMVFIFELIVRNIQTQKINKDFLVASMLAQEGLELVRNSRDENWLLDAGDGTPTPVWTEIVDGAFGVDFRIDYNDANHPTDINGIGDPLARLYIDGSGFYLHDGGTQTPFSRIIEIFPVGTAPDYDYIRVVSTVQWTVRGNPHNYIAETLLYDWR